MNVKAFVGKTETSDKTDYYERKGEHTVTEISLPAFHHTATTQCNIKVDYRMGLDLQIYRRFYKLAYNAEVADADLVREMARRFMDSDREFQTFKSRPSATLAKGRRPPPTPRR